MEELCRVRTWPVGLEEINGALSAFQGNKLWSRKMQRRLKKGVKASQSVKGKDRIENVGQT